MRVRSIVLTSVLLILALAACARAPSPPQTVNVTMDDYGFKFSSSSLMPGEVTFVVKNDASTIIHQLELVRTYLPADQLPDAIGNRMVDDSSDVLTKVGQIGDLKPGRIAELTVKLDPGHYVYICNTPGHYRMGMYGELSVLP